MKGDRSGGSHLSHLRAVVGKVRWGIRTVGWPAAIRGAARLVALKLIRPPIVRVRLRESGAVLTANYPLQLVPALVVFGDLIDPEYPFLEAVAKPGWTFLDVGAAIGQFTVFAAAVLRGRVVAFEPSSGNLETLERNVADNGVHDLVEIHRLALSDQTGVAVLPTACNPFQARLDTGATGTGEQVAVDTLASVVDRVGIEHASVLKINVAGFEPRVIAGARTFLERGGADVLILLIGRPSYDAYRDLATLGYRFFFYQPRERRLHGVSSLDDAGLIRDRPWPARHVLAIRAEVVPRLLLDSGISLAGDGGR